MAKRRTKRPTPIEAAQMIIEAFGEGNLVNQFKIFRRRDQDGSWKQIDDRIVKKAIHQTIPIEFLNFNYIAAIVRQVKKEVCNPDLKLPDPLVKESYLRRIKRQQKLNQKEK